MSVRTFQDVRRPLRDNADFVVVGSGAAGATAAWALTHAGYEVLLVEEGPPAVTDGRGPQFWPAMATLYRDAGMEAFAGGRSVVSTLQGRVLGGSTVVNSAIAWRMPEKAYDRWAADLAIRDAFPLDELHRHWDRLDTLMHVSPTDLEIAGRGNTLAARGAEKLGWQGKVMNRFTEGCRGTGRCLQGCPYDAKMSTALTLIPQARRVGMRVLTSCLVEKVRFDNWGRALGVTGRMRDTIRHRRGPRVDLRARKGVVLAPGCVQLPGLLGASGYRHPRLGGHFQAHPGSGIIAFFDDEVDYWSGATQGWESDEFFDDGMKFEVVNVPPDVNAGRFSGVGRALARRVHDMTYAASWGVIVRMAAQGHVRSRPGRTARVTFTPTPEDMHTLRRGIHRLAELAVASGARCVVPGIYGLPPELQPDEIDRILEASIDPRAYVLYTSHMFGTARAAGARAGGVCDPQLQPWDTKGLWVVDSSVFPTNLGVNPQFSIQAVALHAAERIAESA